MTDEIITQDTEPIYATFHGYGADGVTIERYWDGIPARNLTKAEWDVITNENVKAHLVSIGLYKISKKAGK